MSLHDSCVWKLEKLKKQLTIVLDVDDLLAYHDSAFVTTKCIKMLDIECNSEDPVTTTRGKVHEYLRITIDFGLKRGCALSQCGFVTKMWKSTPERFRGSHRKTSASEFLFKTNKDAEKLETKEKDECHHVREQCLWISQMSLSDLQLSTGSVSR